MVGLRHIAAACVVWGLVAFAASNAAADMNAMPNSQVRARVQALSLPDGDVIAGVRVSAPEFLQKLYAAREYRPVWTDAQTLSAFRKVVSEIHMDGLTPEDYQVGVVDQSNAAGNGGNLSRVEVDLLLSDAFARLLHHLHFGKVDAPSLGVVWPVTPALDDEAGVQDISKAVDNGQLRELVRDARPGSTSYRALKEALRAYRQHVIAGGWPVVPAGPLIKPGMQDARIALVRQRLLATGQYDAAGHAEPEHHDAPLVAAVQAFQISHGLIADGIVGPRTLAAMNVSARERVDQIRVALERARWAATQSVSEKDRILVNVAAFDLELFIDGKPAWHTDVIAGCVDRRTPIFSGHIRTVVFNPDWVVPASIIRRSIFPRAKADRLFLTNGGYQLFTRSGDEVDVTSIDWDAYTASTFPFRVVQRPGPMNAMGRVKFIFPNPYGIYLHDTPSRHLFDKDARAFSSGCIRVRNPMSLAEHMLRHQNGWAKNQIDEVVAATDQIRIDLMRPLAISIVYETVVSDGVGGVKFFEDIYGLDHPILAALDRQVAPPRDIPQSMQIKK